MVPNRTPNAMDVAIGIKNWACMLVSEIIGRRPATVVSEVNKIGLNLEMAASSAACLVVYPSTIRSL